MLVSKTIEIDMGHRVPNHKSKCKNIHGHRYKIQVGVSDKVITKKGDSSEGMVIDFGDLKDVIMEVIDKNFDHGFVMYSGDKLIRNEFLYWSTTEKMKVISVPFIPTAENLAKHWYELLDVQLQKKKINLAYVKVWETPNSTATYTKKEL